MIATPVLKMVERSRFLVRKQKRSLAQKTIVLRNEPRRRLSNVADGLVERHARTIFGFARLQQVEI